jgi:hypothetical protein
MISFPLTRSLVQKLLMPALPQGKLFMYLNHKNLHRVHMRNQAEIFPIIIAFPMFKEAHAWPEISDIAAHEHNILCQQVPVRHA